MKKITTAFGSALLLAATVFSAGAYASPSHATTAKSSMSVKVLLVIPPRAKSKFTEITVHVRVTGIKLDPTHIGRKSVAGHGHMQLYLDRIPASAYKKGTLKDTIAVAAGPIFTFILNAHQKKLAAGRHTYLIALAQNNETLYKSVKPASFTLTLK